MAQAVIAIDSQTAPPPPLEPGDHLTRDEFERRYDAMPDVKKAELIEGVVSMASPVRLNNHGRPHANLLGCLVFYAAHTPGVIVGDNISIRLEGANMPQPDVALIIDPARGGQARISPDDYLEGGPELIVEVAASSSSIDLNSKLPIYRRNLVREYLVWRVLDHAIDWFILEDGEYQRLPLGHDGIYRSQVFPGLWLDPTALTGFDLIKALDVLRLGIADPSHQDFVDRLNS